MQNGRKCTDFIGAVSSDLIHVFAKRVVEMHVLIMGITKGWATQPKQCQRFKLRELSI
jgi:hypothetical protein